ncbi:MAG: gamma carbonic anhydrase family protein [Candidatus Latescibacteria bacterium]|nr:gamma carbonic anhydrase family protein [Candidatus Latescibacterota bacterium]
MLPFQDISPAVDDSAFLAEGAILVGEVCVSAEVSIWFNAVLRGDEEPIRIGRGSNIQDGAVLHTDPGCPCTVGEYVTVGHNAILHGCLVDRGATIGMGATVLNQARVGEESLVAANALVLEGMEIPPRTLTAGVPARVRRELTEEEIASFRRNTDGYIRRRGIYKGQGR